MKIDRYKSLILEHKFFEAHEALEEFWFPRRKSKTREVLIVKGFINAAVSFELYKRKRQLNAKRVWQTYKKFSALIKETDKDFLELKEFIKNFATSLDKDIYT